MGMINIHSFCWTGFFFWMCKYNVLTQRENDRNEVIATSFVERGMFTIFKIWEEITETFKFIYQCLRKKPYTVQSTMFSFYLTRESPFKRRLAHFNSPEPTPKKILKNHEIFIGSYPTFHSAHQPGFYESIYLNNENVPSDHSSSIST